MEEPVAEPLPCGCPGATVKQFGAQTQAEIESPPTTAPSPKSVLSQWPVQLTLVPPGAPFLQGADLLLAADCVPFAYADFHGQLLKGKILLVGCPKLDDAQFYQEKLTQILKTNDIKSVTCAHMEVPCCFGLVQLIQGAIRDSGKSTPFKDATIGIKGERKT